MSNRSPQRCQSVARAELAALACGAVLTVAACGGQGPASRATVTATATTTVTASADPSSATTDSPITDPGDGTPTGTSVTVDPASGTASAGANGEPGDPSSSPVIGSVTSPRKLTLSDVFAAQYWREGTITVPRASAPLQGIYYVGAFCGNGQRLELRFADQKGSLRVTGAQGLDSASSAVALEYRLLADGRLVDTKTVRFSERRTLTAELAGVSSVVVEVRRANVNGMPCGTTAVITDLSIVPTI